MQPYPDAEADDLDPPAEPVWRPPLRRALIVLWPSFVAAGVLEMLVFAAVDPGSVHRFSGAALGWSAQAVHTAAFFVFWSVTAGAAAVTQWLGATVPRERAER